MVKHEKEINASTKSWWWHHWSLLWTVNYLSYIQLHPEVYNYPPPIGHGWMLVDGRCCPVRIKLSALPINLKKPVVDIDGFSSSSDGESDESKYFSLDVMFLE